jgi:hypothetical protein
MKLAKHNIVQLMWVPGHEGIEGNETADQVAKLGAECLLIGLEPTCGVSAGIVKKAVRDWTNRDHQKSILCQNHLIIFTPSSFLDS